MKETHFDQVKKFSSSKMVDWDKGPWGGMSPKKDHSKFEIIFQTNGNFELIITHVHTEDNIDHGERNYEQHSDFNGHYDIINESQDSLVVKLNISNEIKTIKKCTNFDFKGREEKSHNLTIVFSNNKNEFTLSEADIFIFEGGYYGSFLFMIASIE